MSNMFDYIAWRGDLPFSKIGPNPVDLLILSTLTYVQFDGIVPDHAAVRVPLREAAEAFLAQPEAEDRVRVKQDLELLRAAADSERFGEVRMSSYRSIFDPEKEMQFAAVTYFPGDGTAIAAFRGTDRTLVGWKEDFNMTFQDSIPAQREAVRYLEEIAIHTLDPLRLVGHSKGGNLAVYAAAKADAAIQQRIVSIHNQDGPGFSEAMMTDPGYLAIVPKITTYVPESSIVGMLLEHEEPYKVIESRQIGPMQHDPYSWRIMRNDFIHREEITDGSRFLDQAMKHWLETLTIEERNTLADVVYEMLTTGGAVRTDDLLHPKQIGRYVKLLAKDEKKRSMIGDYLSGLARALVETQKKFE